MKHPTPSQATDVLTGDEEQNGKQENKKKETGSGFPFQIASYKAQGLNGEPILITLPPHRGKGVYILEQK